MTTPASAISAPPDTEFVLDDGLDEDADDDLLAFESERMKQAEAIEMAEAASLAPQRPSKENPIPRAPPATSTTKSDTPAQSDAVIETSEGESNGPTPSVQMSKPLIPRIGPVELEVIGMPVGCNRTHLEALVGTGTLRSIRLGAVNGDVYGPTVLVVTPEAADSVLALKEPVLRGKRVTIVERTAVKALTDAFAQLPVAEWTAAAERARESFEQGARETQKRLDEINEKYELSVKASAAAAAAASAVKEWDEKVGASKSAAAVAEAATVAAKEVDENWRVSERAREAVNAALTDERTAPAARMLLGVVDTPESKGRRKEYTPSGERRNPDAEEEPNGTTPTQLKF